MRKNKPDFKPINIEKRQRQSSNAASPALSPVMSSNEKISLNELQNPSPLSKSKKISPKHQVQLSNKKSAKAQNSDIQTGLDQNILEFERLMAQA